MPIWIKFILAFWVFTIMEHIVAVVFKEDFHRILFKAKISGYASGTIPWYIFMIGFSYIISFFLLIPFFVWAIFLR